MSTPALDHETSPDYWIGWLASAVAGAIETLRHGDAAGARAQLRLDLRAFLQSPAASHELAALLKKH